VLQSLVNGCVYPSVAPENAPAPRIVYQRVGGARLASLCGPADLRNSRFQIDAWAKTCEQANTLIQAIELALTGSTLNAIPLGEAEDGYEAEAKLYRARQDFSIWHR
jgi:hypothetical protein